MPRQNYGVVPTVDENGLPVGVVDTGAIELRAQRLVFKLGALCPDQNRLRAELGEEVAALSVEDAPLVLAAALRMALEDLLAPTLELLKATGTDLTIAFREIAEHLPSNVDGKGQ